MPIRSNLEDLVVPLTEDEFLTILRERKLTLMRGERRDRYADLLDWETLLNAIMHGEVPPANFRITRGLVEVPRLFYVNDGKVNAATVDALLAKGASIIVNPAQSHVPALFTLCNSIRERVREKINAGVIMTTGTGGALKLHYDVEDIIVLQVEGTKRWQIFSPAVFNPVSGMPDRLAPAGAPTFDEVLEPGDFLFVPGGHWHRCDNGPGRSVHGGILFVPPTGWHAVKDFTSLLREDELFRAPVSRIQDAAARTALEDELKNRLIERVQRLSLNDLLENWKN